MSKFSYVFNAHPAYIESIYKQYLQDPASVEEGWRVFFEGFDFGLNDMSGRASEIDTQISSKEFGVMSIIHGFRSRGHLLSTTNPIMTRRDRKPHLDLFDYGLSESDLNSVFKAGEEIGLVILVSSMHI